MPLKIRERDVEEKVVRYAKSRGCLIYKFSSPSHRGVCDRIIIGPKGVLFLELKRPGEKPTALQQKFLADVRIKVASDPLASSFIGAEWADNVDTAKTLIDLYCL